MPICALTNGRVFDGEAIRADLAVLIRYGEILDLVRLGEVPDGAVRVDLGGDLLAPGFVDLQVNGGGGVLFNDRPTVDGLRTIAAAHRRFGTTAMLPTLITSERATRRTALTAVADAIGSGVPGIAGIHLEGPHLDPRRAGVHEPALIGPPEPEDLELATSLRGGRTLVTVAPNQLDRGFIERLAERDVVVSAGHTDGAFEELTGAHRHGISGYTHLFNAMSPLGSRAPGAVGAALAAPQLFAGIIVDGHHVHPVNVGLAHRLKPDRLFLVTDAMPPVGSPMTAFRPGERDILVRDGRCTTGDGRLAGALLDMAGAVMNCVRTVGIRLEDALRMASLVPARFAGLERHGRLAAGARADLVLLDGDLRVRATWIAGEIRWEAS